MTLTRKIGRIFKTFCDFSGLWGTNELIWAMWPRAHGPIWARAHGPRGRFLKIFDFLDFFSLSAQYVFLNFGPLMTPSEFSFLLKCSQLDYLISTNSLKGVKFIEFYCRDSIFP